MSRLPNHRLAPMASASPSSPRRSVDDWEEWEDEDVVTPIDPAEQVLIDAPAPLALASRPTTATTTTIRPSQLRASRPPSTRIKRLKSKHRQKAQNAKAGIKLITDMTAFRRQNHVVSQLRTPDGRPIKFVDAAALKALEGEPSSASVGNWNWLKRDKGKSPATATPTSSARSPPNELTPGDAPIMIGFTLSPEETSDHEAASQGASARKFQVPTTGSQTNLAVRGNNPSAGDTATSGAQAGQQVSVWSPDTPDTASSGNLRPASSVYSQATNFSGPKLTAAEDVPPIPALPSNYKKTPHQRLISLEVGGDSDDGGTPCTLFEEDGSPNSQRQARARGLGFSPDSAGSRSNGWWDHVVTPFLDKRFTLASTKTKNASPKESPQDQQRPGPVDNWVDEKKPSEKPLPVPPASPPPIVRAPTPRRTPTPPSKQTAHGQDSSSPRSSPFLVPATANYRHTGTFYGNSTALLSAQASQYPRAAGPIPCRLSTRPSTAGSVSTVSWPRLPWPCGHDDIPGSHSNDRHPYHADSPQGNARTALCAPS